ncbi:hypothetical protein FOCC_FOCC017628 [Frankliniella occidentalis]|nr:hypothetical protein FOCC_FOCC017628 [Frankliniella occidentalis]
MTAEGDHMKYLRDRRLYSVWVKSTEVAVLATLALVAAAPSYVPSYVSPYAAAPYAVSPYAASSYAAAPLAYSSYPVVKSAYSPYAYSAYSAYSSYPAVSSAGVYPYAYAPHHASLVYV